MVISGMSGFIVAQGHLRLAGKINDFAYLLWWEICFNQKTGVSTLDLAENLTGPAGLSAYQIWQKRIGPCLVNLNTLQFF